MTGGRKASTPHSRCRRSRCQVSVRARATHAHMPACSTRPPHRQLHVVHAEAAECSGDLVSALFKHMPYMFGCTGNTTSKLPPPHPRNPRGHNTRARVHADRPLLPTHTTHNTDITHTPRLLPESCHASLPQVPWSWCWQSPRWSTCTRPTRWTWAACGASP